MSSVAIITARGGSRRIPNKNIKDFCGKPILAYSIDAALSSELFQEVMVSTDCPEIANIALEYGAKVPFLRSEAAGNDYATTEDVLLEVLEMYSQSGLSFETVCCIYPTAPFVTANKLIGAKRVLDDHFEADAVIPVVRYSFPPQRGMVERNGCLTYQYPENALKRSQDLEPIFHDCGQFYFCRISALKKYHNLICPKSIPYEISEEEVQNIDNYSDWGIAELKYQLMQRKARFGSVSR